MESKCSGASGIIKSERCLLTLCLALMRVPCFPSLHRGLLRISDMVLPCVKEAIQLSENWLAHGVQNVLGRGYVYTRVVSFLFMLVVTCAGGTQSSVLYGAVLDLGLNLHQSRGVGGSTFVVAGIGLGALLLTLLPPPPTVEFKLAPERSSLHETGHYGVVTERLLRPTWLFLLFPSSTHAAEALCLSRSESGRVLR